MKDAAEFIPKPMDQVIGLIRQRCGGGSYRVRKNLYVHTGCRTLCEHYAAYLNGCTLRSARHRLTKSKARGSSRSSRTICDGVQPRIAADGFGSPR